MGKEPITINFPPWPSAIPRSDWLFFTEEFLFRDIVFQICASTMVCCQGSREPVLDQPYEASMLHAAFPEGNRETYHLGLHDQLLKALLIPETCDPRTKLRCRYTSGTLNDWYLLN